jgi:uncharacterized SAM-binding protein YcdF (DUF218 family)
MFDTLFFYLSKLLWAVIAPSSMLLLGLLLGMACLLRRHYGLAKWVIGLVTSCLLGITLLPVGQWLLYPLESRFPTNPQLPADVKGIILLGGSINALESFTWNQIELNASAERNVAFLELAQRYPKAQLVMTGGSGSVLDQDYREADMARELYAILGMDSSRIIFERNARNTIENARFTRELMQPLPGEHWVLITSAFHMPRSIGVFCAIDWPVLAWPVDHQTTLTSLWRLKWNPGESLAALDLAVHEWLGLMSYFISGRSNSPYPASCPEPQ